jgi:predicted DNA-binding transcriptional regulator YafY
MENSSRSQFYRQRQMIGMIRDGMARCAYANATAFVNAFEVPRRTVLRDLDFLRDDQGAPIEYDASRKGYYLSDLSWSLRAIQMNRQEVFAFGASGFVGGFRVDQFVLVKGNDKAGGG